MYLTFSTFTCIAYSDAVYLGMYTMYTEMYTTSVQSVMTSDMDNIISPSRAQQQNVMKLQVEGFDLLDRLQTCKYNSRKNQGIRGKQWEMLKTPQNSNRNLYCNYGVYVSQ